MEYSQIAMSWAVGWVTELPELAAVSAALAAASAFFLVLVEFCQRRCCLA